MPTFDWSPESPVFCDLETASACNLKQHGAKAYLRDATTKLLCAGFLVDGALILWSPKDHRPRGDLNPSELWPEGFEHEGYHVILDDGPEPPWQVQEAIAAGRTFVAHNAAGFDAPAWERFCPGPQPAWFDTVPVARAAGLPAGLDALGEVLVGRGKDPGRKAMPLLTTAKEKHGEISYNLGTVALWKSFLRYTAADVLLLERVYRATGDYGEEDVLAVDAAVNARGVAFDRRLALGLVELWAQAQASGVDRLKELTRGALHEGNVRSVPQVRRWLADQGLRVASLNRTELESLYADPEGYFGEVPDGIDLSLVCDVLRLRQGATRITSAKLQRLLGLADSDDRVRGMLVYWGAHTGRWSGRGFQPHNLPRGAKLDVEGLLAKDPLTLEDIDAARGEVSLDDALSTLLRPVFKAEGDGTLLIVDYAAVEARGVAWMAEEPAALEAFRDPGQDIYLRMAERIFGRPCTKADVRERFIGKQVVLGCGYGLGPPKFEASCKKWRIDLGAAGTTAAECVEGYRDLFTNVAGVKQGEWRRGGLWKNYGAACLAAVKTGRPRTCHKVTFDCDGGTLRIILPSGRPITYQGARVEDVEPGYAKALGLDAKPRPTVVYRHPHGYDTTLYGGLLTENIVQGVCRDLLATALVNLEAMGFFVVLHVHDEIVVEQSDNGPCAERDLFIMAQMMSTPPPWAEGFPVGVEGFSCRRYTKSPFSDSHRVRALNGRVL